MVADDAGCRLHRAGRCDRLPVAEEAHGQGRDREGEHARGGHSLFEEAGAARRGQTEVGGNRKLQPEGAFHIHELTIGTAGAGARDARPEFAPIFLRVFQQSTRRASNDDGLPGLLSLRNGRRNGAHAILPANQYASRGQDSFQSDLETRPKTSNIGISYSSPNGAANTAVT